MYKFSQVQFVKRKDYIDVIVCYSKNGQRFRSTTGVRVNPKHILSTGGISSKHPNYETDLDAIKFIQERIENLVTDYKKKFGDKPEVEWLTEALEKPYDQAKKDTNDLLSFWPEFIKEKEITVRAEGTINKYNNLKYALESFKQKKNHALTFDVLDQKFFNDFISYMVNEHEYVRNPHQKKEETGITSEVGLSNETAISRIKNLIEYLKFCSLEFEVDINLEKVKKWINLSKHKLQVKPLSKSQKWELTFTTDELQFFINLNHYEPEFYESLSENQKRYMDILFFMCLQGTAPIDTKSIKRTDIKHGKIVKERSKTGNEFKVELDPISLDILERNNYNMNFTDQTLNEELKRIFVTAYELYRKHYEANNNEPYEIITIQKTKKGNREIHKVQHRGLFVELMTGRRSFITNLSEKAEELGLKETMDKVGHVKVATTLGYIHGRQQTKKSTGNLFGIHKIK